MIKPFLSLRLLEYLVSKATSEKLPSDEENIPSKDTIASLSESSVIPISSLDFSPPFFKASKEIKNVSKYFTASLGLFFNRPKSKLFEVIGVSANSFSNPVYSGLSSFSKAS